MPTWVSYPGAMGGADKMWRKIAPLLIVLSIALNGAFIGVWLIHVLRAHEAAPDEYVGGVWCPLHRHLGVTDEQWRRIEPGLVEFQESARTMCVEANRACGEMIDLIAAPEPDREAIRAKQEEIMRYAALDDVAS